MSRTLKRFCSLYNLLLMWDRETADYYYNCVDNGYGGVSNELITTTLLLEMECSVSECVSDVTTCPI